uniref:Hexosyltransferase n=1 Tax=Populus alba TaxID=43335 RepID=A0A4U5MBN0_POPAL|nr:hypothetical protein D5086_0000318070 [Populus alba]
MALRLMPRLGAHPCVHVALSYCLGTSLVHTWCLGSCFGCGHTLGLPQVRTLLLLLFRTSALPVQPNTVALHQIKCHSSPTATSHPLLRHPNHQQSQNLKTQLYPSLNPLPSTFSSVFTDISSHWPFWDRYLRSAGSNLFQFFVVANLRTLFEHFILVRVDGALIDRPKLLGFVGTQTGFESGDRRAALRSTWFPCDPDGLLSSLLLHGKLEQATGLSFRFVIARSKDAKKMALLEKEVDKYKDFMLAYFKTAFQLFEADYYVKADDDFYLRPDCLATLLAKEIIHSLTYI